MPQMIPAKTRQLLMMVQPTFQVSLLLDRISQMEATMQMLSVFALEEGLYFPSYAVMADTSLGTVSTRFETRKDEVYYHQVLAALDPEMKYALQVE